MIDLAAITELDDIVQLTEKFHDAEFCIGAGKLSAFMNCRLFVRRRHLHGLHILL